MPTPEQIIHATFTLYERHGADDYIGEAITQIEHMSQAAELAMAEGFDDEVVLAAFFHDIGHLCGEGAGDMGGYGWSATSGSGPSTCAAAVSASAWPGWCSTTSRPSAT